MLFLMCRPLGECGVRWRKVVLCGDARYLPGQVGIAFCRRTFSCVSAFGDQTVGISVCFFFPPGTEYSSDRRRLLGVLLCGFIPLTQIIGMKLSLICTTRVEQLVRLRPTPVYSQGLGCHSASFPVYSRYRKRRMLSCNLKLVREGHVSRRDAKTGWSIIFSLQSARCRHT